MKIRYLLTIGATLLLTCGVQAQDFGTFAFGAQGGYAFGNGYKHPGFGITIQRLGNFGVEYLRMNISGMLYPRKDDVRLIQGTAGFDYVFPIGEKIGVYPSAKLAYQVVNIKGGDPGLAGLEEYMDDTSLEEGSLGLSLGGGVEYYPHPSYKVFAETRYNFGTKDQIDPKHFQLLVGIAYVW